MLYVRVYEFAASPALDDDAAEPSAGWTSSEMRFTNGCALHRYSLQK
jgi:hypothetical protein